MFWYREVRLGQAGPSCPAGLGGRQSRDFPLVSGKYQDAAERVFQIELPGLQGGYGEF